MTHDIDNEHEADNDANSHDNTTTTANNTDSQAERCRGVPEGDRQGRQGQGPPLQQAWGIAMNKHCFGFIK